MNEVIRKFSTEKVRWDGWESDVYGIFSLTPVEYGKEMLILKDVRRKEKKWMRKHLSSNPRKGG